MIIEQRVLQFVCSGETLPTPMVLGIDKNYGGQTRAWGWKASSRRCVRKVHELDGNIEEPDHRVDIDGWCRGFAPRNEVSSMGFPFSASSRHPAILETTCIVGEANGRVLTPFKVGAQRVDGRGHCAAGSI